MKKIITLMVIFIFIVIIFSGCSNHHGELEVLSITSSLNYYNKKAIENIDSLIGRSPEECKTWIEETYGNTDLEETTLSLCDDFDQLSYVSKDKRVEIYFIFENDFNRFFIKPVIDDNIEASYAQFATNSYKKSVDEYCADNNADYKHAPAICELAVYNFDKANSDTTLYYYYLFNDYGWGWIGDTTPYNSKSFYYDNNIKKFICLD